jgi:hypothetical protein
MSEPKRDYCYHIDKGGPVDTSGRGTVRICGMAYDFEGLYQCGECKDKYVELLKEQE